MGSVPSTELFVNQTNTTNDMLLYEAIEHGNLKHIVLQNIIVTMVLVLQHHPLFLFFFILHFFL